MAKYDVFISCSLKDSDEIKEFVNLLTDCIPGILYYTDAEKDEFDETQKNALNDSECLLFMQSDGSLLSSRIKDEVVYAKSIGKKVVPVLLKGAKKSGWYMFKYGSLGFVDSNDSAEIDKLINSISEWTGKNIENIVTDEVLVSTEMVADAAGEVKSSTDKDNVVEEKNNTHFNELFVYEVFTPEPTVEEPPVDECINDESFGEYTIEEGSTAQFEELPGESYDEQNGGQYSDTSVFDESSNDSSLSSYETIGERDATEADTGEYINEPQSAKAPETTSNASGKQPQEQSSLGLNLILMIIAIVFVFFRFCSSDEDNTTKRANTEGFIAVSKNGKWGFVNSRNKKVVPIKYDIVEDYYNGFAIVGLNGKWGYVNKVGKEIVPIKYEKVFPFMNDRGCIKFKGKYGLVDTFGRILVNPKYDNPISFAYGDYAPVAVDGKWGIVDKNGKEVLSLRYDDVGAFFDGVARVQKDGKYGFVGIDGTIIANPIYDKAREFTEGFAAVQKNGKWGFVDYKGNTVTYLKYTEVKDFRNSRAAVMSDGKWGFIDNSGKEVVPLKYDSVGSFITNSYGTFANVTLNGKEFFIDENGNPIKFS
ncbi:MAG: WG repeat-containing protein [Bacteroidaceae bacterium]|nr:WG repeat-containing protein [Bacteroidaceae bacterium]